MSDLLDRLRNALADRYAVERELGRGGMGLVFLAEEMHPRRQAAIKILQPDIAAVLGTERFLREVDICAKLTHPHIVPIFAAGEADGLLYYVMPYIAGESLRRRLERERVLPLEEALRIGAEVADALDYAHRQNIIHRDIKPENVLLEEGHAVVTDFGVARALVEAGGEKLTQTGFAVGTPMYMSPEQAAGDSRIDGRADIYALGCVLYEMLGGTAPFGGPSAQAILARHMSDPVPPLSTLRPGISDHAVKVVEKALAKTPVDRWSTGAELGAALRDERVISGDRVAAAPAPGQIRPRKRVVTAGLGMAAVAAVALLLTTVVRRERPQASESPAIPENMVLVPGGSYRLFGGDCSLCLPGRVATVDSFFIDRTEVTVGEYAKFVASGVVPPPWREPPQSTLPVSGVMWSEAVSYCRWRDPLARLPAEEEWEAAARGTDGRRYPWGDAWEVGRANAAGVSRALAPVGSFSRGASLAGALDLSGNAWEWTDLPRLAAPGSGERRYVIRGGAFDSPANVVTTFYRSALPPTVAEWDRLSYFGKTGFRCARAIR